MSELERIKRVIEVGQLQWFSATDVKLLVNEVERLKSALESVYNAPARETMRKYAERALNE